MMWYLARRRRVFDTAVRAVLAITVVLCVGGSAHAEEGKWTVRLEPIIMDAYGHDQHVLTIHEIDLDATPLLDTKTAMTVDTNEEFAYRGEIQYNWDRWGLGLDFFWFLASQTGVPGVTAAGGNIDEVVFEIADRSYTSSDPSETLFYEVLGDTTVNSWALDAYGMRTLVENPGGRLRLQLGIKFGDYDNDYRAVVGIRDVGGTRVDASSNYGLMMGPLVGLEGRVYVGRSSFEGYVGQAMLFAGTAELSSTTRDFTGPFSESPAFFAQEGIRNEQDVVIPITDLRLAWMYRVTDYLSLGAGVNSSVWWNVPVPPGIIPGEDGNEALHENTIVYYGFTGIVEIRF